MVLFLFDLKYSIPYSNYFDSLNRWKQNYLSFLRRAVLFKPVMKTFLFEVPTSSLFSSSFVPSVYACFSINSWLKLSDFYFVYYLYRHVAHSLSSGPWRELGVNDAQVRHYIIAFDNFLLFSSTVACLFWW